MPSVDSNLSRWDQDWGHNGDDWSHAWGSGEAMWRGSVHARIGRFLPTDSLLEIAPGHGRLTAMLLPHCQRYVGVDLAPSCVEACRARFRDVAKARFVRTDGTSLPEVDAASIDFAFSWDSLVHADQKVLHAYLAELARVLKPGGAAFLHHSNLGSLVDATGALTVENPHWRDPGVSADTVRDAAGTVGLHCVTQECIQWGVSHANDCFSLLRRPPSAGAPAPAPQRFEHPDFNSEMRLTAALDAGYWRS